MSIIIMEYKKNVWLQPTMIIGCKKTISLIIVVGQLQLSTNNSNYWGSRYPGKELLDSFQTPPPNFLYVCRLQLVGSRIRPWSHVLSTDMLKKQMKKWNENLDQWNHSSCSDIEIMDISYSSSVPFSIMTNWSEQIQ